MSEVEQKNTETDEVLEAESVEKDILEENIENKPDPGYANW